MKNQIAVAFAAFGIAGAAIAGPVEPDAFADAVNINNAYTNVTLSSINLGAFAINANVYSWKSLAPTLGVAYTTSTGTQAFGWQSSGGFDAVWGGGAPDLRADFAGGTTFVSIDVIGNNGSDFGFLSAYRADNTLIGTSLSGLVVLNQVVNISVASGAGDIAYIIAAGVGGDTVGLDNMNFADNPIIPLPGGAAMAVVGMGVIGVRRRRPISQTR